MEDWNSFISLMRQAGVEFDTGLTDAEVSAAEATYGFRFPPDLRAFLQTALPCGKLFPNWRSGEETQLREWLDLPLQGILMIAVGTEVQARMQCIIEQGNG